MEYVESTPEKDMSPEEILDYVAQIGRDLAEYAIQAQAMLDKAESDNVQIDLSQITALDKFKPLGENEKQLVLIRSDLLSIQGDLYKQGVRVPTPKS